MTHGERREVKIVLAKERVTDLKRWFTGYVQTFQYNDMELQRNIDLKKDHTRRVCTEILDIGGKLGLDDDALRLAEIIALLHDIGRFEQYARYQTFMDGKSENHAELGLQVLERHGVLTPFDDQTRGVIVRSIRYHNQASLPREETKVCLFFTKLLRDADKLDIWKVVTDYYHREDKERNGAIELDLPDTTGFSEEVYRDLIHKRIVDINHVKNLNDFKLLQIGWIFDINFPPTLQHIRERRYLEMIRDVLPESKEIDDIFEIIHRSFLNST